MGDQAESVRLLNLYARRVLSRCITQVTILFSPPKTGISLYESLSWHDQVCWLLARLGWRCGEVIIGYGGLCGGYSSD